MNFSSKQTNPLLPTLLLSGSHMFARLPSPHLLTLSCYLQTFACPHSLPLFVYLCSPTTPSHICIRLLAIPVFFLPIISYIRSSPLLNPSPYAHLFSLFECVCFSLSLPLALFSYFHAITHPLAHTLPLCLPTSPYPHMCASPSFPLAFSPLPSTLFYFAYAACLLVLFNP